MFDIEAAASLVSPFGLVSEVRATPKYKASPPFLNIAMAQVGRGMPGTGASFNTRSGGCGRAVADEDRARLVAVAEAAERYAASSPITLPTIVDSAVNLGDDALDLGLLPKLSTSELADSKCGYTLPDEGTPIRWIRGRRLGSGEEVLVPLVMASYMVTPWPRERFWYQLSTGFAVHADRRQAEIGAICEIIERDALAIIWMQQIGLNRVHPEDVETPTVERLRAWCATHFLELALFDATTDLLVPTVYALVSSRSDEQLAQVVGASTSGSFASAAEVASLEALGLRPSVASHPVPDDPMDCSAISDGAAFMARASMSSAFDFLETPSTASAPLKARPLSPSPEVAHKDLLERLARLELQAFTVDLTTRDLEEVGLVACVVLIPSLMPMSLHRRAQFRAHPRLYELPPSFGADVRDEKQLNVWPHPFA